MDGKTDHPIGRLWCGCEIPEAAGPPVRSACSAVKVTNKVAKMDYKVFIESLQNDACPDDATPGLRALWYDANGEWNTAHKIVQAMDDAMGARIHAYLHRKEGDEGNSRYWHRQAGSTFPSGMNLEEEWDLLVRALVD